MCPKEHNQKAATQPARKEKEKEKENERARHAEPRCLGPKPRLCGWKKSRPGRMCRSWSPKKRMVHTCELAVNTQTQQRLQL